MIDLSEYEDRYSRLTLGQSMKIGWEQMISVLFRPFTLKMIVLLGLLALFANMQTGGGAVAGGFFSLFAGGAMQSLGNDISSQNLHILLAIIVPLALIVWITWTYVQCRLKFIYLLSFVKKEVRFLEYWREVKSVGNSYFWWELLATLYVWGNIAGAIVYVSYILRGGGRGTGPYEMLLVSLPLFGLFIFFAVVCLFVLRFIMPLMFIKRIRFLEAWRLFRKLFELNKGPFAAYYFGSLGLYMGLAIATSLAQSVFFIPIVNIFLVAIATQPLVLWFHAWALAFYAGFGDDLNVFVAQTTGNASAAEMPPGGNGND